MKFKFSLVIIFLMTFLFAGKATQEQIRESIDVLVDHSLGIRSSNELTTHLILISQNINELNPEDIKLLEDHGFSPKIVGKKLSLTSRSSMQFHHDVGLFRIHYDTTGAHAIDRTDNDENGLPDYLDIVIRAVEDTYTIMFDSMGYVFPPPDMINDTEDFGGSDHYDIYLQAIGSSYYGYTQPEEPIGDNPNSSYTEKNVWTSYVVLRNNYDGFPNTEEGNIQVTMAHEFFHSVQFGYDGNDEIWFMEATATWMEDQAFTDVNDVYYYMPGWFKYPHYSLHTDRSTHSYYGTFIFFQYISENYGGPEMIKYFMDRSVTFNNNDIHSTYLVIDDVLNDHDKNIDDAMIGMAVANRIMHPSPVIGPYGFLEANNYDVLPEVFETIDFTQDPVVIIEDSSLESFATRYYSINSQAPVKVEIQSTGITDKLTLAGILKNDSGLYLVKFGDSSNPINIDPGTGVEFMSVAVISTDDPANNNKYKITFSPGISDNPFILSSVSPQTFITSRQEEASFNVYVYQDIDLEISVMDGFGKTVRTIEENTFTSGVYTLSWDGFKDNGRIAESGQYLIKVKNPNSREEQYRMVTLISSSGISVSNPYPNPSFDQFKFSVTIGSTQEIKVKIYDINGNEINELASRIYPPGVENFKWNGKNSEGQKAPAGIYFIGVVGEDDVRFKKATLIH